MVEKLHHGRLCHGMGGNLKVDEKATPPLAIPMAILLWHYSTIKPMSSPG